MSELTTTARPYARAIFEMANDAGKLTEWSETLQFMSAVASNEDARRVLDNPKVTKEAAGEMLIQICGDALDDQAKNLARLLAENSRISVLPEISTLFEELKSEVEGSVDVQVTSAFDMSDEEQGAMASALKAKLGREVKLSVVVDESIMGGVIIRAGDMVIDGSIQGRLNGMAHALNG